MFDFFTKFHVTEWYFRVHIAVTMHSNVFYTKISIKNNCSELPSFSNEQKKYSFIWAFKVSFLFVQPIPVL